MGDNTLSVNDILSKQYKEIQELKEIVQKRDDEVASIQEDLAEAEEDIRGLNDKVERFRYSKQWDRENVITVMVGTVIALIVIATAICCSFSEYQKAKMQPKQLEQIKEVLR